MIAPAAFEDLTFPEQKLQYWSGFEANQWLRATQNYFTSGSGNNVTYGTPIEIGSALSGGVAKYGGACIADNGKIYASGHLNVDILIVDTSNDNITTTGNLGSSPSTNGIFYSPITRCVYTARTSTNAMYKLNIDTNTLTTGTLPSTTSQYFPFVLSYNGLVAYSPGGYTNKNFTKYDLLTDSGSLTGATYSLDRSNACLGKDGCIYAGAANGTSYVKYNPDDNSITNIGSFSADTHPGMIIGPDGNMYGMPNTGTNIIRINVPYNTATNMATPSGAPKGHTQCIGADGNIYSVGDGNQCTVYDWRTDTTSNITLPDTGGYHGICMGVYGDLYCIPWSAGKVAKIPILNNGRVLKPILEWNGVMGRFQTGG